MCCGSGIARVPHLLRMCVVVVFKYHHLWLVVIQVQERRVCVGYLLTLKRAHTHTCAAAEPSRARPGPGSGFRELSRSWAWDWACFLSFYCNFHFGLGLGLRATCMHVDTTLHQKQNACPLLVTSLLYWSKESLLVFMADVFGSWCSSLYAYKRQSLSLNWRNQKLIFLNIPYCSLSLSLSCCFHKFFSSFVRVWW